MQPSAYSDDECQIGRSVGRSVEVPGIEPGSFGTKPGLLRAEPALSFSAPTVTQACRRDGLSCCWFFRATPQPGHSVEPPADARSQVGGTPGLTDFILLLRQQERNQRGLYSRLSFAARG